MMAMVALVGGILVAVLLIGLVVVLLFMSHGKGQSKGDELAVSMAKILNANDRQGRMNILVERSRELVFTSRQAYEEVTPRYRHLEPLARQLMNEARAGAQLVESGRQVLAQVTVRELVDNAEQGDADLSASKGLNLNWFKAAQPRISAVEVGNLKDIDSNVYGPEEAALPLLKKYDLENNFLNQKSGLYKGNINAKLPAPDNDLSFKLSSLPAPVKGTIAAARLAANEVFQNGEETYADGQPMVKTVDQIPSAVKIKVISAVSAKSQKELKGQIGTISTASTNGGAPPPDEVLKSNDGQRTP